MNKSLIIDGRPIGPGHKPYIIAELSANHNGSIDQALQLISAAAESRADAIKLQTYRPDTITIDCDRPDFVISSGLWAGRTLYNLYEEAHMPWEWHKPLFDHAKKVGITIFSTPFDVTAVDLLEDLEAPAYKIASFEAIDLPLIAYVASKKKPMIISTGIADDTEIREAIETARSSGCKELAILHCVSGYPAPAGDYNLKTITDMQERFGCPVGLSDHTLDNTTAIAATALGACIIEKHVTLDRTAGGPDDSFSLEVKDLAELCNATEIAWSSLGAIDYGYKSSERENAIYRRSLYFVQDAKKGDLITKDNIRSIRPGYGIPPKHFEEILGKELLTDVYRGEPVRFEHFNKE